MSATSPRPVSQHGSRQILGLLCWLAFCLAAAIPAIFASTGGWFESLNKPSWNPPSWVFGPVWTALYLMMAVAAWLVWRQGGWKVQRRSLTLFVAQWFFNALWTPLFFSLHLPGVALGDIVLLWLALAATLELFWEVRPAAGVLLLPYLAWVTFATALNFTIWRMNV